MKETNWGIIGPGNIAKDFVADLAHIPAPQKVIAVLGHRLESSQAFAAEFGVPHVHENISSFLEQGGLDAVYIATPHPQHFEQALLCLAKEIPVLCEKPVTINASQLEKLIKVAGRHQTFLMEAMWIRFLPSIHQVLNLIEAGQIGRVTEVNASMTYAAPRDPNSRYFDPELGGGSLLDLGIYPIFLASLLLGAPSEITASGKLTDKGVDEQCTMKFVYPGDAVAHLGSSLNEQLEEPAVIKGEKGVIRIMHPWFEKSVGVELELFGQDKVVYPCAWEGHGLQYEVREVLDCLHQRQIESAKMPHAFSLLLMTVMDEVRNRIGVTYERYE